MKAVVAAFNQEKVLVGAFSVITNLRMELFEALLPTHNTHVVARGDVGVGGLRRVRGGGVGRGGGGGTASGGQHAGDQHLNISYIISYIVLGTESTAAFC